MPTASPNPALGVFAKFAIGPTSGSAATLPLDFNSETLGLRESFLDPQGLRGTRAHAAGRVRASGRIVTGDVVMDAPTAVEWSYVLQYILGGAPSGTSYPLAEALPVFGTDLLRGATLFRYTGCRVSRAVFRSGPGRPLSLTISVLGIDETQPGGAFPTLTLDNTTGYFVFPDSNGAVVVNGTTLDCMDFELTVDNVVQARAANSQTATVVYTTDRIVTWRTRHGWGDAETLYGLSQGGVAVSATFTNGTTSIAFSSPKVQYPRQSPDVTGRDEIYNELLGMARFGSAAGDELAVTLDSTP
jgi:hypothetical protein